MSDELPLPRRRTAATPKSRVPSVDATGEHLDDRHPLIANENAGPQGDEARNDVVEPLTVDNATEETYQPPWWIVQGEQIDSTALSNRKKLRERQRVLGLPAGYDSFWGFVDNDPVSVVPTVRAAQSRAEERSRSLARLNMPQPPAFMASSVVTAAAAFGIVGGPAPQRLVTSAITLTCGFVLAVVVANTAIPPSRWAIGAVSVTLVFVVVSAVPLIHMTRSYTVLAGFAFAAAGLLCAALWPIARAWRIERQYWSRPELALVAALLDFAFIVELADRYAPAFRPQERRRSVADLDRAATQFELAWYRVHQTGVDVTDRQLRAWSGRIRAETRDLQRLFAVGSPATERLLMCTYELIQAIVNRFSLADHEDTWVRHGSWRRPPTSTLARLWARTKVSGRYVRQCLLAGLISIAALFLLANTIWVAVPTFIGTHMSPGLGSALTFDPTVRVFVAGISVSMFAVAAKVFSRRH